VQRFIAILLLLLVAAGAFYPCCLDDDCAGELTQTDGDRSAENSDKGFCSPFSACASCAASVDITTGNYVVVQPPPVSPRFSEYLIANVEEVYSSLFQPPRNC